MREYRKKNPEKMKAIDLKKNFGLSLETYYEILKNQNYVCAICKRSEYALNPHTGLPRALAVDHCHETGKVRGLLCTNCNRGIGKFDDKIDRLAEAIKYLSKIKE